MIKAKNTRKAVRSVQVRYKSPASRSGVAKRRDSTSRYRAASPRRTQPLRPSGPSPERYREIQQALAQKGYYDGPVDGIWNSAGVDALKRFQADQMLAVDGKLGSLSLIALGLGPKRDSLSQVITQPDGASGDATGSPGTLR